MGAAGNGARGLSRGSGGSSGEGLGLGVAQGWDPADGCSQLPANAASSTSEGEGRDEEVTPTGGWGAVNPPSASGTGMRTGMGKGRGMGIGTRPPRPSRTHRPRTALLRAAPAVRVRPPPVGRRGAERGGECGRGCGEGGGVGGSLSFLVSHTPSLQTQRFPRLGVRSVMPGSGRWVVCRRRNPRDVPFVGVWS